MLFRSDVVGDKELASLRVELPGDTPEGGKSGLREVQLDGDFVHVGTDARTVHRVDWRTGEDQIRAFFGNVEYGAEGLEIDLPEYADVGSSVPITVRIKAAMTEADYPKVLHLVAHKNPTQHVMSAWFRPESGKAEFSTRIRQIGRAHV